MADRDRAQYGIDDEIAFIKNMGRGHIRYRNKYRDPPPRIVLLEGYRRGLALPSGFTEAEKVVLYRTVNKEIELEIKCGENRKE